MQSFDDLSKQGVLNRSLVEAVEEQLKFSQLTPVQAASIPRLLNFQDVAVQACTGSGKTLAYLLPVYELLLRAETQDFKGIGAVVLSPTRELASQIYRVSQVFTDATGKRRCNG